MAIKQVQEGWFSTLAQKLCYSPEEAEQYEIDELARRNAASMQEAEDELAKLPSEQFHALCNHMMRVAQQKSEGTDASSLGVINVWLNTRPEYKNDEHNKNVMMYHLKKQEQWPPRTTGVMDAAFVELNEAGLLHINKKALEQQQAERDQAKAAEIVKHRNLTEREMYELPADELRRRANAQLRGEYFAQPLNNTIGEEFA